MVQISKIQPQPVRMQITRRVEIELSDRPSKKEIKERNNFIERILNKWLDIINFKSGFIQSACLDGISQNKLFQLNKRKEIM